MDDMDIPVIVQFQVEDTNPYKLQREGKVKPMDAEQKRRIRASVREAVLRTLEPSAMDLKVAAQMGLTREDMVEQLAMEKLDETEARMVHAGVSAVDVMVFRLLNA